MEKTNELNKFLSYIHMGNSVYRIYYEASREIEKEKLTNLIVEIQETFKTHEERIVSLIKDLNEIPTKSLTFSGRMGVCMEKMKSLDTEYSICLNAIKATNMGLISSLKFLRENNKLAPEIKEAMVDVVNDYNKINAKLTNYLIENKILKKQI